MYLCSKQTALSLPRINAGWRKVRTPQGSIVGNTHRLCFLWKESQDQCNRKDVQVML